MSKQVDTNLKNLLAIDLFAGCGGLTFGLEMAGFKVVGAVEIDLVASQTFQFNHPTVDLVAADVADVNPEKWMKKMGLAPGDLALLAGCPPCQGFSRLRTRNGSKRNCDNRNKLIFQMIRFAVAFQPKALMIENVPELVNRRLFKDFIRELKSMGYFVGYTIKDVANYGVPQRRKRMILLASKIEEIRFAPIISGIRTVRDSIGHLGLAGSSGDRLHDFPERRSQRIVELISEVPKDGGGRLDLPNHLHLKCHGNTNGFKDVYGRMAWNKVAPTITTGCFNPSKGRFLHPFYDRCITMREAALLQSFPPCFNVPEGVSKVQVAKMLGNALPPEFVRHHANSLRQQIE